MLARVFVWESRAGGAWMVVVEFPRRNGCLTSYSKSAGWITDQAVVEKDEYSSTFGVLWMGVSLKAQTKSRGEYLPEVGGNRRLSAPHNNNPSSRGKQRGIVMRRIMHSRPSPSSWGVGKNRHPLDSPRRKFGRRGLKDLGGETEGERSSGRFAFMECRTNLLGDSVDISGPDLFFSDGVVKVSC